MHICKRPLSAIDSHVGVSATAKVVDPPVVRVEIHIFGATVKIATLERDGHRGDPWHA